MESKWRSVLNKIAHQYMYFYDDSISNIESVSARKDITCVLVPNKNKDKHTHLTLYEKKCPNNKYIKIINPDELTLGSGLSIDRIQNITYTPAKLVIFDWDLTLSIFNGLYVPDFFYFPKEIPIQDIAHFYAGNTERFEALRHMFQTLRDRGTRIYILTDNGWGQHPHEFVHELQ